MTYWCIHQNLLTKSKNLKCFLYLCAVNCNLRICISTLPCKILSCAYNRQAKSNYGMIAWSIYKNTTQKMRLKRKWGFEDSVSVLSSRLFIDCWLDHDEKATLVSVPFLIFSCAQLLWQTGRGISGLWKWGSIYLPVALTR